MERPIQQHSASFKDYPWSSPQDIFDYYDLRYLFDDDEIIDFKRKLIEDADKHFWCTYDDDEDLQYNEDVDQPVSRDRADMEVEEENWDEDEDWDVRFVHGIGFIVDGYDSGYDEPYPKRQRFPSGSSEED